MRDDRRDRAPRLEWIAAGIGLLLLLAVFAVLLRQVFSEDGRAPPGITVIIARISPDAAGYRVELDIVNDSPVAVTSVSVEAVAGEEKLNVMLDHLPGNSRRSVGVLFSRDPRGQLGARATSYVLP